MAQGQRGSTSGGQRGKSHRGFAAMDDEQQRRIARKGGQASARSQQRDQPIASARLNFLLERPR